MSKIIFRLYLSGAVTMRVLIVEDDPTTGHLMKYVVGRHAEYDHAVDGEEAFDKFCDAFEANEPFDLVFLDLMLPVADGQEVLQAIRAYEEQNGIIQTEGVPVVITSALEDNSEVYQAMAAGAIDYLMKPVKTEKLIELLQRVERSVVSKPPGETLASPSTNEFTMSGEKPKTKTPDAPTEGYEEF